MQGAVGPAGVGGYLGVTQELSLLPVPHGAQDGLPHRQLEFLANNELHGLPAGTAVIQHMVLPVGQHGAVVESGLGRRSNTAEAVPHPTPPSTTGLHGPVTARQDPVAVTGQGGLRWKVWALVLGFSALADKPQLQSHAPTSPLNRKWALAGTGSPRAPLCAQLGDVCSWQAPATYHAHPHKR